MQPTTGTAPELEALNLSSEIGTYFALADVRPSLARALAFGLALAAGACTRGERDAQGPSARPGAVAAGTASPAAEGKALDLASATPENPLRPELPKQLMASRNGPGESGGPPRLEAAKLPPGFSIALYSADVPNARSIALGRKGTVFVSTRRDDKVYAVVDENGDYRADRVHVVARGLDTPNGVAYRNGSLYIAEISRLLRLDDIDDRLNDPPKPVVLTDKLPDEKHHGWRYIRFGPDGWLYIPIGAPCNICERSEPIFSTVARIHPDGTGLEVFASGVRNSVGFDWHPQTKELWFTENGRDELGDELPPDELDRAPKPGLNFGFPRCHAGVIVDPEYGAGHACTEFEPPVQKLGPHVAALGMRFYTGKMFPDEYRQSIIIAEHGSWNREKKLGYRLMKVRLDGNRAVSYEPFVTGFLDGAKDEVWGRPVDVEVLGDGSLLMSDDYAGALYRITYEG